MTNPRDLIKAATPLPWHLDDDGTIYSDRAEVGYADVHDVQLIVFAVNHVNDLAAMTKWILQETDGRYRIWDHACLDCTGPTSIVIEGFVCAVHRARRLRGVAG